MLSCSFNKQPEANLEKGKDLQTQNYQATCHFLFQNGSEKRTGRCSIQLNAMGVLFEIFSPIRTRVFTLYQDLQKTIWVDHYGNKREDIFSPPEQINLNVGFPLDFREIRAMLFANPKLALGHFITQPNGKDDDGKNEVWQQVQKPQKNNEEQDPFWIELTDFQSYQGYFFPYHLKIKNRTFVWQLQITDLHLPLVLTFQAP